MSQTIYVVSNAFGTFALNEGVTTPLELRQSLESALARGPVRILLGQGLDEVRIQNIIDGFSTEAMAGVSFERAPAPMAETLIHKSNQRNVLISDVRVVGQGEYEADLVVNDQCDQMLDHQSGQHLQGLLVLEASRQMMLAVVELHAWPSESRGGTQYVLNDFTIQYKQFAFPIPTILCGVVLRCEHKSGAVHYEARIDTMQLGEVVCAATCIATGRPADTMASIEARKARRVARALLARHEEPHVAKDPALDPPEIATSLRFPVAEPARGQ